MVARSGMRPVQWAKLTFRLTIIYTVLVMLSCMAKADSLNITVCCLAIYQLMHTSEVTKNSFRGLVLLLLLSLVYDMLWYFMQSEQENSLLVGTTFVP
jgi:inner membrane protein involved in colicin E2 resistance